MKLSIIMPCYNVEQTLGRALDSIFMQHVDFDYEIIIVNDGSRDSTHSIAEQYRTKHSEIIILDNPINCGNSRSFYNGLCVSRGDYFCVLDGDDYFVSREKLKRQISFLDNDLKKEYVATATEYVIDLGDDLVSVPPRNSEKEFSYVDWLLQKCGYYHTATYVFRNIFRGNVPEFCGWSLYRGDTPRLMFHLIFGASF